MIDPDILEAIEERAAIMEYDGGLDRAEAELKAVESCPEDMQLRYLTELREKSLFRQNAP